MKTALIEQHTATDKRVELVELSTIPTHKQLQLREFGNDAATIARYVEAYRDADTGTDGFSLPPVVLFRDGDDVLHIGDGHHRIAAARKAGMESIPAIIRKGDRRAALLYATSANAQHGLALTPADKAKIVGTLLADEEWVQWSDRQIADHCHVSPNFVGKIRKQVGAVSETRKGKDGRTTKPKPAAKAKPEAPEPIPFPVATAPAPIEPETLTPDLGDDPDRGSFETAAQVLHQTAAPTRPPAAAPAKAAARPDAAPVEQRQVARLRHLVAQRLIHDKPRWHGNDRTYAALILLVGVPTLADIRFGDALLGHAQASLDQALALACASALAANDPTLPDAMTMATLWGFDGVALALQAEREERP